MAKFFIDRPIFAWVIAIVIMLTGFLALRQLPIQQYPSIAPPAISVSANYPGGAAKTVEDSVTQIIEQSMTGLDNLLYMSSQSDSFGNSVTTLNFAPGTDVDTAQVQVQNKVGQAEPLLPQAVLQQGIRVDKANRNFLMVVGLVSADGTLSRSDMSDYANSTLKDVLARTEGVGNVRIFGSPYAMRIWLQADKLTAFALTPVDVRNAIQVQNSQLAVGQLGGLPAVKGQQLNATILSQTRFENTEQFENILLKVNEDGSQVRLKDVARVEIGAENYNTVARYKGKPATGMAIQLASGANALDTAARIRQRLSDMEPFFPPGLQIIYPYDTTPFVRISIKEVVNTLVEAVILVFLVMFLFLGNFRATLIPTIAVPVVLLGTFGVMSAFGFSINTLTMFGLVLAIGLLVDDAIVVVENVERIMDEDKLPAREATRKSMEQITGALVGIALVLSAVFVPMAFFGGATGLIYRQFSLTIVSAMALSVLVALTLTPALCATLLKPNHGPSKGLFGAFNRLFNRASNGFLFGVGGILKRPLRIMGIYFILVATMGWLYVRMPSSLLPNEDQGLFLTLVQLPTGATQERTDEVLRKIEQHLAKDPDVDGFFTVAGFSFAGQGQNMGLAFVKLKHWDERKGPSQSAEAIVRRAWGAFNQINDAMIFPIMLPPIPELGTASGFDVNLVDRAGLGHDALTAARNQLLGMAAQDSRLFGVRPNGMDDVPTFHVDIDYEKVKALGLEISDVNSTLGIAWGSAYVNDFIDRGRVKRVYLQGDAPFRMLPQDFGHWYVRNQQGDMISLNVVSDTHWAFGSPRLERFNGVPAMNIQGQPGPGYSSGDAMDAIEELVLKLPEGIGLEWTGTSYQERIAGSQATSLYAISLLVVFLCLAALYESWTVPMAVIMAVPLGVLGALLAVSLRGLGNDVYFQVGLLTTIGLASKNAILIVEFAKNMYDQGSGLLEATIEAARIRLRPIVMTSMAFCLGVLPLAISTGAGAASRHAIGTGVIGGMLSATFLAIFFVPLFFILVIKIAEKLGRKRRPKTGGKA